MSSNTPELPFSSRLYCLGGRDEYNDRSSSISYLDSSTNKWVPSSFMSLERSSFCGASIGDKIYICGGESETDYLDTLEMFDCPTETWTQLARMPEHRRDCSAAVLDDYIYVSGGRDCEEKSMSSVVRYSIARDEWETVSGMLNPRDCHQLVQLDGLLYAIGGVFQNDVERYDPRTDQWSLIADTHQSHWLCGATAHNGRIYVCSHNGSEVYSPEADVWRPLPALNGDYGRSLDSFNGSLIAVGGGSEDGGSKSVYQFHVGDEQWSKLPDMDASRWCHCSFVVSFD